MAFSNIPGLREGDYVYCLDLQGSYKWYDMNKVFRLCKDHKGFYINCKSHFHNKTVFYTAERIRGSKGIWARLPPPKGSVKVEKSFDELPFKGVHDLREGDVIWCCNTEGAYSSTNIPSNMTFLVERDRKGLYINTWDSWTNSNRIVRGMAGVWRIGMRGHRNTSPTRLNFDELGFKEGDRVKCVHNRYVGYDLEGKEFFLERAEDGLAIRTWSVSSSQHIHLYGLFGEWKKVPKHQGPFSAIILDRDGIEVGREKDVPVSVSDEEYKIDFSNSN